jgi:hypothetical protein
MSDLILFDVSGLSAGEIADVRAHIRSKQPGPASYDSPEHGWTCFHCGETFHTNEGAKLHFGEQATDQPRCRKMATEIARLRALLTETGQKAIEADKAKRRALAIADERSKENVAMRAALEPFAHTGWMTLDTEHTERTIIAHVHGDSLYELKLSSADFYRAKEALGK